MVLIVDNLKTEIQNFEWWRNIRKYNEQRHKWQEDISKYETIIYLNCSYLIIFIDHG